MCDLHRYGNASKTVPCDGNKLYPDKSPEHYRLEYHIYIMFLEEGDTSEETFFRGMEKMAYPDVIKTHGKKVSLLYCAMNIVYNEWSLVAQVVLA